MAVDALPEVRTLSMLPGLVQRPPELGRIRLGEKKTSNGKEYPSMLRTFRLTSGSKSTLEAAAKLYGGTVRAWDGAPDEGQWQLITAVAELDILIPTAIRNITQSLELWQGGTCERRCDETVCTTPKGTVACLCAAAGQENGDRACEIMTRLSVMLPRVPGLGVWRLDTSGYQAATTLPTTLTLLSGLAQGKPWMPAILRAEQRSKKERITEGKDAGKVQTHRFVVPVLDLPGTTLGQFIETSGVPLPTPQLASGERPTLPTARERVANERARVQGAVTGGDDEPPLPPEPGGLRATDEAGSPLPAEVAAPESPSTPEPAAQCETASPYEGNARCRLFAGHEGHHRSAGKESW